MNRPWRVDDYIAQLPRYGKKKTIRGSEPREQVRTARRGSQNPQGRTLLSKTRSWFSVLILCFVFSVSNLTPGRFHHCWCIPDTHKDIQSIYIYTSPLNWNRLSVSQDIHSFVCFAKPCSVSKRWQVNKQSLNLRRAPRQRQARAVHRSGPAAVQRRLLFLLEKAKRLHATEAFTPRPRVLACSCFFSPLFFSSWATARLKKLQTVGPQHRSMAFKYSLMFTFL